MSKILYLIVITLFVQNTISLQENEFHQIEPNQTSILYQNFQLNMDQKIYGGVRAELKGNEHIVSLRLKVNERIVGYGWGHICGGSLITPKTVLTAGHCLVYISGNLVIKRDPSEFTVVMGILDRFSRQGAESRDISKLVLHENYNINLNTNDIGLMLLTTPFTLGLNIKCVQYADVANFTVGQKAVISGWGAIETDKYGSRYLLTTTVNIVDHRICNNKYSNLISKDMFCAEARRNDSCQGDSGGPFLINGIQYGIVSWGKGCALDNYPGVYTNVAYFKKWIINNSANKIIGGQILLSLIFCYFLVTF